MRDADYVAFLQWALPLLGMRWPGFRKVRRQVCRRIACRLNTLGLSGLAAYRAHLEANRDEWAHLDGLCRIPISRFYRDRAVFDLLAAEILGKLPAIRVWSAGCGAGEEPYTLAILLRQRLAGVRFTVVASDADPGQLARARRACYPASSLKELPPALRQSGFQEEEGNFCLRQEFRRGVEFAEQDIRHEMPDGPFDLVLCRNLAFTYFAEGLQKDIARRIHDRLRPGGYLVVGRQEALPPDVGGFAPAPAGLRIYRRSDPIEAEEGLRP